MGILWNYDAGPLYVRGICCCLWPDDSSCALSPASPHPSPPLSAGKGFMIKCPALELQNIKSKSPRHNRGERGRLNQMSFSPHLLLIGTMWTVCKA